MLESCCCWLAVASCCFLLPGVAAGADSQHWDYTRQGSSGPDHWAGQCSSGRSQSPVSLPANAEPLTRLPPLQLAHWDAPPARVTITNNGHTAKLTMSGGEAAKMSGGGLGHTYTLAQAHFHWGAQSSRGSEHQVDGIPHSMELHLVHHKSSLANLGAALAEGEADSLAVLGIFLQEGESQHPGLQQVLNALGAVVEAGTSAHTASIPMARLLPGNLASFWRYNGSLTTPGCNEVVQWTVLREAVVVSREQLAAFRALRTEGGQPLEDNYRPVQPLAGRTVWSVETAAPVWCSTRHPGSPAAALRPLLPVLLVLARIATI